MCVFILFILFYFIYLLFFLALANYFPLGEGLNKLLILEAKHQVSAGQALDHPWVLMTAGSSMKNL